ncbi:hypothetical protein [Paracoccus sp. MC1862]|uniref:hypothetical protein n=1 Tax=Paracoccus sp. MC1862 TaxID=2760307 RepID=UPI0016044FC6|nr:hypothetical protein [Paracoccus sp. MC1862]MBB1498138.1 hypothetical protein [Paracoccus sp. MC1862]QQO46183.1 hypothetical protein JGR78_08010 [Paracoccus sp. MC1862]
MLTFPAPGASETLGKVILPRAVTLPADFAGAVGNVDTSPAAGFAIDVTRNGFSVGTITIDSAGAFAFATAGGAPVLLSAGDVVRFVAPSVADTSIAGISMTIRGSLV